MTNQIRYAKSGVISRWIKFAFQRSSSRFLGLVVVLALLATIATGTLQAKGNPNPGIVPPNASYGGITYGEWQALLWQWLDNIPAAQNPGLPGNEDMIATGQPKHVWFLATPLASLERYFKVPAGKALYVVVVTWEWDNFICTEPPTDYSVDQLRALAAASVDSYGDIQMEIDGVPVKDIAQYRSTTPVFSLTLPENNLWQSLGCSTGPGTYAPAVADGINLMLTPLSVGEHLIDGKLVQNVVPGDPSQDVHIEFILHITVEP